MKSQKKAGKKKPEIQVKRMKSPTKVLAATFPMVKLIDEQVRTSIPEEVVKSHEGARKQAKKKDKAQKEAGKENQKDKL